MTFTFEDCQKATARIYRSDSEIVCGAGFLVNRRYVMTCAHVVNDALGLDIYSSIIPTNKVEIDFPKAKGHGKISAEVVIWKCPSKYHSSNSDLALLRLNKETKINPVILDLPLNIPCLKSISENLFKVWGFPNEYDQGLATEGKIVTEDQLRIDANMPRIIGGFSGAPVWDICSNKVIGMVMETDTRDQTTVDDYGSSYNAQGFDGRTAFIRKLDVLSELWFRQGKLFDICHTNSLWQDYQDDLLEAYYSSDTPFLKCNLDSLVDLIDKISDSKDSSLQWVDYLLVNLKCKDAIRQRLMDYLEENYPKQELRNRCKYLGATQPENEELADCSHIWIFLDYLDTSTQVQLSNAYYLEGDNVEDLDSLDLPLDLLGPFDTSSIASQISPLLKNIFLQVTDAEKCKRFLVEFFLPYESILDLSPDTWKVKRRRIERSIGCLYSVVIRISDREQEEIARWLTWKSHWKPNSLGGKRVDVDLLCCKTKRQKIIGDLRSKSKMGLKIEDPPKSYEDDSLMIMLDWGVPIALWLRKDMNNCHGNETYKELVPESKIYDLPETMLDLRNSDPSNMEHVGNNVTLLWDDPTVAPPPNFDLSYVDTAQKLERIGV